MNNCSNLYFLSTLACKLVDCLSTDEATVLAADLLVLSDMMSDVLARQAACKNTINESVLPHTSETRPSLTNT